MPAQTKRFKKTEDESNKVRQLSGLFTIISNNLFMASEILGSNYTNIVDELESFSMKAKKLANDLMSFPLDSNEDINDKVSFLKQGLLALVLSINNELSKFNPNNSTDKKIIEDIILVRRLLREAHRGLITIQD